MKKFFIHLFAILLISCNSYSARAKETVIEFETPNIPDIMRNVYDYDLNVGIFAVDENILFLFGSIGELDSYPLQSTILRSEDGGLHWLEVMKPEEFGRVSGFQILNSGNGWALIHKQHGSAGPITLFHTIDFGKSWEKVSEIPKNTFLGFPTLMYFANDAEGQIDMVYPYEMPAQGYIAHLSTYDGGKTWQETGRYSPPFEVLTTQPNVTNAYNFYQKPYDESLSLDKRSRWKITSSIDELMIYRKLPKPVPDATGFMVWQEWQTIITFPLQLDYQNGMLKLP